MANYTGYEAKAGDVLHMVEATCRHLTDGGEFTSTSTVPGADVERFCTASYYWLVGELLTAGFGTAITGVAALNVLSQIQALDAAVQVETSIPTTDSGEPNERYKGIAARRDRMVRRFVQEGGLENLGITRSASTLSENLEGTGRSITRKNAVYANSNVPQSRFARGFGQQSSATSSGADPNLQ